MKIKIILKIILTLSKPERNENKFKYCLGIRDDRGPRTDVSHGAEIANEKKASSPGCRQGYGAYANTGRITTGLRDHGLLTGRAQESRRAMSRVVCRPPTGPPRRRAPVRTRHDPVGRRQHTVHYFKTAPSPWYSHHRRHRCRHTCDRGGGGGKHFSPGGPRRGAQIRRCRIAITYPNSGNVNQSTDQVTDNRFPVYA